MFTDSQPFARSTVTPTEVIVLDDDDDEAMRSHSDRLESDSCFTKDNLCDALVDVCGILLPKRASRKTLPQSSRCGRNYRLPSSLFFILVVLLPSLSSLSTFILLLQIDIYSDLPAEHACTGTGCVSGSSHSVRGDHRLGENIPHRRAGFDNCLHQYLEYRVGREERT